MIPKIIHHFAPDKDKWHPLWEVCLKSWMLNFPEKEYQHKIWNDDAIINFVREKYSNYFDIFNLFPTHIMKLDFARYLVVHEYGGLYVDMDIFCYKNFYNKLNKNIILLEALCKEEIVQNSMFGGIKNEKFFIKCINNSISEFLKYKDQISLNINKNYNDFVHRITGSYLLSDVYKNYEKNDILILNKKNYNPYIFYYDKDLITKHMLTGLWGAEDIIDTCLKKQGEEYTSYIKKEYLSFRKINIDNFDFYTNYDIKLFI